MTRLSACYFCGTALDDPVEDYPVLPEALHSEDPDPTTVTLCGACHEKLEGIVAEIGDAVDAVPDSTAGSAPPSPTGVGASDDADDVLVEPESGDGDSAGGQPPSPDDAPDRQPQGVEADANAVPDPRQSDPGSPDAATDEAGDADEETTPDGKPEADSESPPGDESDDGERSVVEGGHDISALEYNKVMRLLQNREFPVDREEIEIVAANAYQVARSDCANVIDVAVERGLIDEVDGQLRKPENG